MRRLDSGRRVLQRQTLYSDLSSEKRGMCETTQTEQTKTLTNYRTNTKPKNRGGGKKDRKKSSSGQRDVRKSNASSAQSNNNCHNNRLERWARKREKRESRGCLQGGRVGNVAVFLREAHFLLRGAFDLPLFSSPASCAGRGRRPADRDVSCARETSRSTSAWCGTCSRDS